jgi:sialate O-acetylesterase
MKKILLIICLISFFLVRGEVSLASIFSDNMVLQRNSKIPVWGWAKPNEIITITFNKQSKTTKTDRSGNWIVRLEKELAGGPYRLLIQGENDNFVEINNILVGEVWLCSGQSNMEWTVGQSDNAKSEIENANFSTIRHIKLPKEINSIPNSEFKKTSWEICSPSTVSNFSGIGFFYAKQLQEKLHIPIGIINASWGGTNIETWISREGFENNDALKEMISEMPKIDFLELTARKAISEKNRVEQIQKAPISLDSISRFKDQLFDDGNWPEMKQPGIWEEQALGDFDGIVWFRKHFTLSKNDLEKNVFLNIPAIDDEDITYINGIKIGETKGWDKKRSYSIPAEILEEGDNVIAIRMTDNGGGGGIYGDKNQLRLLLNNEEQNLSGLWKFQVEKISEKISENDFPSLCFNSMINPLIPFAFKGVIWYQGESNVPRAFQYRKAFPLLITDWRSKWNTNFPFYFVQLATFSNFGTSNDGCPWAELREAQALTLKIKKTGMAITTDVGNPKSIHPTNKQVVGKRLASIALNNLYQKKMIYKGPTFKTFSIKKNEIKITFINKGSGLKSSGNNPIYGFEIAGKDSVFYEAKSFIKKNKVVVYCDKVQNPLAVRFGWMADASKCNLFNNEDFPAQPFRTDNWITITKKECFKINL